VRPYRSFTSRAMILLVGSNGGLLVRDSGLDTCPKLDANLKPEYAGGQPVMTVGGSSAVRKAIEKYHIHEAKGFIKIGRTLSKPRKRAQRGYPSRYACAV
jgi:hypothetical protein